MVTGFQYYTASSNKYFTTEYRRLKRKRGAIGCCVVDFIVNEIYRVNGYFAVVTPDFVEDVAEYWGVSAEEVVEVVKTAISVGIFDTGKYASHNILTSAEIQTRFLKISANMKRKGVAILPEYSCDISKETDAISNDSGTIPEQFPNDSGTIPEQFPNDSGTIPTYKYKYKDKGEYKDNLNNLDNLNNTCCFDARAHAREESAADGDTKQQGIKKIDIEKYFFVERRMVQAEKITERFWNFNGTFDWQTSKGRVKNPKYAAKLWKPLPEELGGHACTNEELAGEYFDFVKSVEHLHPDGAKLLSEFNNISVEADGTTLTYNDCSAGDILDAILINNQETAFKAFKARFNSKTIKYSFTE